MPSVSSERGVDIPEQNKSVAAFEVYNNPFTLETSQLSRLLFFKIHELPSQQHL